MNKRKSLISFSVMAIMVLAVLAICIIPASAKPQPVQLTGRTTYVGRFSTSGFLFSPAWYNYCNAEATLTQTGKNAYSMELDEWDCGRVCSWDLKISNGGRVTGMNDGACCANGSCVEEIQLHTGCPTDHGPFPVYKGTWDGTNFNIASHFHGRCNGGLYWGDPAMWDGWFGIPAVPDPEGILDDGVTWDDGPAHVTFGVDMSAAD